MDNQADEMIRTTIEQVLSAHFEDRPYRRLALTGRGRADEPRGSVGVCGHHACGDLLEFKAEIRIAAPLDQELRLVERMLEAIAILHDADVAMAVPDAIDAPDAPDAPVIIAVLFETAAFERRVAADEAAARLVFAVRATTN